MSRSLLTLSVVFLAVFAVVIGSAGIAQAALVGYWPMNDTSGTVAADMSGAAITNPGTYVAATLDQTGNNCPFGTYALFSGVSTGSGVSITVNASSAFHAVGGTSNFTECVWYYLPTTMSGADPLLFSGSGNAGQLGVATNNRIWWYPQDGSVDQSSISSPVGPAQTGTWIQITAVSPGAGNKMALYLDGVQVGPVNNNCSGTIPAITAMAINGAVGGSPLQGGAYTMNAGICDAGWFSTSLTAADAAAIYNVPTTFRTTGLNTAGTGRYGLADMQSLFNLYAAQTGTVGIGAQTWQYDASVPGGHSAGQTWTDGTNYYIQLGTSGGVETTAGSSPEPGTLALLAAGLAGLLCYAWRKRK